MTEINWNEFSLQIRAVSSNWCDADSGQHKAKPVLPLTLSPLLSNLQLKILILIYLLTARLGVPQLLH